jgi:hypothetical protein
MKSTQIYHISCFVCISVLCSFSRGPLISPLQTLSIKRATPFSPPLPLSHHPATAKREVLLYAHSFSLSTCTPPLAAPCSVLSAYRPSHSLSLSVYVDLLSTHASNLVWRRRARLPLWRGGGRPHIDLERRLAVHTFGEEEADRSQI